MTLNQIKALKCCENELQASAAGFPGAWDDLTIYIRIEFILENHISVINHILKENGQTNPIIF